MELDKKIGHMIELGDSPDINWLVHVLNDNVSWSEWIPLTEEEIEKNVASGFTDYPYRVVSHPIKEGNVVDLEKGKYVIAFNNEKTRNLLFRLSELFEKMRDEYYRMGHEFLSERWNSVSDKKPCSEYSAISMKTVLITGPALHYIFTNGVTVGLYDARVDKYFITGKSIEYTPTHWRELPPSIVINECNYELVKDEVERLKILLGQK